MKALIMGGEEINKLKKNIWMLLVRYRITIHIEL